MTHQSSFHTIEPNNWSSSCQPSVIIIVSHVIITINNRPSISSLSSGFNSHQSSPSSIVIENSRHHHHHHRHQYQYQLQSSGHIVVNISHHQYVIINTAMMMMMMMMMMMAVMMMTSI
jgi:hypothetical protein